MSIKLQLDKGFEKMVQDLELSSEAIDRVSDSCIKQSAQIMQSELKNKMQEANVPQDLVNAMPNFKTQKTANTFEAEVGYKKGTYNPSDLSDGYKVVFLNYGTPHRTKHGKVTARGFIQQAKAEAKPKIRKAQKEALKRILERLKK